MKCRNIVHETRMSPAWKSLFVLYESTSWLEEERVYLESEVEIGLEMRATFYSFFQRCDFEAGCAGFMTSHKLSLGRSRDEQTNRSQRKKGKKKAEKNIK